MHITEPRINEYMKTISRGAQLGNEQMVLQKMEDYAQKNDFPIVGPLVGRFLRQMALATGARRIFEMGSGYGYSAIWFAGGLAAGGKITCTDGSEANKSRALEHFRAAGFADRIEFQVGDARDILKKFDGPFDIIFNDIDKEQYPDAFALAVPRLRKGGFYITDNVLWSGRILDGDNNTSTKGVIEHNRLLFKADNLLSSIIPIRDGLGLAIRL
jgi:caffeoyl-CoA O-methyltransferase